jgi:hypothetical protein
MFIFIGLSIIGGYMVILGGNVNFTNSITSRDVFGLILRLDLTQF